MAQLLSLFLVLLAAGGVGAEEATQKQMKQMDGPVHDAAFLQASTSSASACGDVLQFGDAVQLYNAQAKGYLWTEGSISCGSPSSAQTVFTLLSSQGQTGTIYNGSSVYVQHNFPTCSDAGGCAKGVKKGADYLTAGSGHSQNYCGHPGNIPRFCSGTGVWQTWYLHCLNCEDGVKSDGSSTIFLRSMQIGFDLACPCTDVNNKYPCSSTINSLCETEGCVWQSLYPYCYTQAS